MFINNRVDKESKKILVTKEFSRDDEFDKILRHEGFELIYFPTIKISGIRDFAELDEKLAGVNKYDGIFFTSGNAVKYFFERANALGVEYSGKIYSVGKKTKLKVESYGYKSNTIPEKYSAEGLLESLPIEEIKTKHFLFPRGNLSMEKLKEGLTKYAKLDEVVVYNNALPEDVSEGKIAHIMELMGLKQIMCVVFFSPSAIINLLKLIPGFKQNDIKLAVIGNTTQSKAEELGLKVDIVADRSVLESLAASIIDYFKREVKYAC
jgi:uroporphyrinogen III methyltransferase/synthase